MTPDQLADDLEELVQALRKHGDTWWSRTKDWTKVRLPFTSRPDDGLPDDHDEPVISDRDRADRDGDIAAARYHQERVDTAKRLSADARRMVQMCRIVCPDEPRRIQGRDMLAAQVAADGWCVSCWRHDQHLTPIDTRPSGQPYYRDRCRFCGSWRAEHGGDPPLPILQMRHSGRRITQADVDKHRRSA